jgi:hypothetical protein
MKKNILLIILFNILFINLYSQSRYWEDKSETEKNKIITIKNVNGSILKLYQGKYDIRKEKNDKRVEAILKILTENKIDSLRDFYFFVFNQICVNSDADLSENLGVYCKSIMLYYPKYVFGYFGNVN